MNAEGWYADPFHVHESRWFSDGIPTDLVRDGDAESFEMPPTPTWDPPSAAPERAGVHDGSDLLRAGDPPPPMGWYDPALGEPRQPWWTWL